MNPISYIRSVLGVTQSAMAEGIKVSQGSISHYEGGKKLPPDVAERLISYAASLGHTITFNDVYQAPRAVKRSKIRRKTAAT